jgi:hypothetical protein
MSPVRAGKVGSETREEHSLRVEGEAREELIQPFPPASFLSLPADK